MPVYVALLRAVNLAGTSRIAMSALRELCGGCGFDDVATYIQSGNVVFSSRLGAASVKRRLESALHGVMGKPVGVYVRTPAELATIVRRNPFKEAPPQQLLVLFLERPAPANALGGLTIPGRERVRLSGREIFVHYPDGMGRSKLKVPFADVATGRNLNTVTRLLELSRALPA